MEQGQGTLPGLKGSSGEGLETADIGYFVDSWKLGDFPILGGLYFERGLDQGPGDGFLNLVRE